MVDAEEKGSVRLFAFWSIPAYKDIVAAKGSAENAAPKRENAMIRAPQDAAAGLFLIAIALVAVGGSLDLHAGTLNQMGPGMLPRAFSAILAFLGLCLIIGSLRREGEGLDRWHLRGPVFILGAAVLFGLIVRPAGLAVAGPLVVLVGAQADHHTKIAETAGFAVVMTLFCVGLFKFALGLPIPVAPWLLGY